MPQAAMTARAAAAAPELLRLRGECYLLRRAARAPPGWRCRCQGTASRTSVVAFAKRGRDQDPDGKNSMHASGNGPRSAKGASFERADRRKGRPAHLRSPDDTPLRDANRDFMLGVLTARATRTLVVYLESVNVFASQWLLRFINENPITLSGTWEDICGDTFLRKLLSMPSEEAPAVGHADGPANLAESKVTLGCDDVATPRDGGSESQADADADADAAETRRVADAPAQPVLCVDPRGLVESILEIRAQLSKEVIQDLKLVPEDNNELLRESLKLSLQNCVTVTASVDEPGSSGLPRAAE